MHPAITTTIFTTNTLFKYQMPVLLKGMIMIRGRWRWKHYLEYLDIEVCSLDVFMAMDDANGILEAFQTRLVEMQTQRKCKSVLKPCLKALLYLLKESLENGCDRFKQVEYKGVPPPLSGDYTPRAQEDIDDSLYVYGKHGPQPQLSSSYRTYASSIVFLHPCMGKLGTESDLSVNDDFLSLYLSSLCRLNVSSGTHIKSGSSRVNTGKQHVNSGSMYVNSVTTHRSTMGRHQAMRPAVQEKLILTILELSRNSLKWDLLLWRIVKGVSVVNGGMLEFCGRKGFKQGLSNARKSFSKWGCERMNRTLIEAARPAAGSEHNATKKSLSSQKPSSTPISKSADDIMVFRKELDALALKHLGPCEPRKVSEALNDGSWVKLCRRTVAVSSFQQLSENKARLVAQGLRQEEGIDYAEHQSWLCYFVHIIEKHGYKRGTIDKTLFIRRNKKDIMLVQVYVDDIIFGSTNKSWCAEFEALMQSRFQMSSMGELTFFLAASLPWRPSLPSNKRMRKLLDVDVHLYEIL
ncbi:copia protein [Tanacetum coccineum]